MSHRKGTFWGIGILSLKSHFGPKFPNVLFQVTTSFPRMSLILAPIPFPAHSPKSLFLTEIFCLHLKVPFSYPFLLKARSWPKIPYLYPKDPFNAHFPSKSHFGPKFPILPQIPYPIIFLRPQLPKLASLSHGSDFFQKHCEPEPWLRFGKK